MTQNPVDARILHEKALKTASALKYVVVPLTDGSPRPATFVQPTDDAADIAFGHRPCVFTLPTAYELVRNLKATRGLVCTCITEVQFHELALKSIADNPAYTE